MKINHKMGPLSVFVPTTLCFIFVQIAGLPVGPEAPIIVQEVGEGHTVMLNCHSVDDTHNFMFWELASGGNIIGPSNHYDLDKYNYQVLTGKLWIRNVSTDETGFYKCVSRGIDNHDLRIHAVDLVVRKKWEDVYDNDTDLNMLRALIVIVVLLVLFGVGLVMFKLRNRFPPGYIEKDVKILVNNEPDSSDEDSTEEVFTAPTPSTSKGAAHAATGSVLSGHHHNKGGHVAPDIDTDFHAVFAALHTPDSK